jgi:threonine dehydratase
MIDLSSSGPGLHEARYSVTRIQQAATLIDPQFLDTPQFVPEALARRLGLRLVVKVETVNPIRSFKARGPYALMAQLTGTPHLVCVTAGNFGQGMAHAARARGLKLTAFAKADANALKLDRMRGFGARVELVEGGLDQAHEAAKAFADAHGALLIQDGRVPAIAEGAGTIGIELLRSREAFDAVVVPLGDGSLLGGIAAAFKALSPKTRMIGVCAAGAPAMALSWRSGRVESRPARTMADGIAIQTPFAEPLAELRRLVDDILLISEEAIVDAMRLAHRELGLALEPAGAAGLAALIEHGGGFRESTVATVLTGGNPTEEQLRLAVA